jgi:uncharacterized protein (TIGR00725 family)
MPHRPYVAVVGPGEATERELDAAERIGRGLADQGAIVVCGGLGGVMEAVCHGVAAGAGTSIGLLPGSDRASANPWVQIVLPTGLGELRNGLVIRAADAVIAVGGAHGTLSEIALALKTGKPVIGLDTWAIDGIEAVKTAEQAVRTAIERARPGT